MKTENEWEIVREARDKIRRTRVPGGWIRAYPVNTQGD
jgi:hypothetical protein